MFEGSLVAIDIGSYAIKIAEISGFKTKKVTNLGVKLLPSGIIVAGSIQDPPTVEVNIINLLKEMKVRQFLRHSAISLGGSNVMIKRAKIMRDESKHISDQIFQEAEQQFQMDMNDLYFDYFIQEEASNEFEKIVLLVGAKRETLDERIDAVVNSGIKVAVADTDNFALTNLLEYTYGMLQGLIAIINMGASSSNVVFLENGHYVYSREIGIGGDHYTKSIAEVLNLPMDQAEKIKTQSCLGRIPMDENVHNAIKTVNDQITAEFQMASDFFFQSGDAPVGKEMIKAVFLTGGGAMIKGVSGQMAEKLKIPVTLVDPFQEMGVRKSVLNSDLYLYRSMFSVCAGLSLRSVQEMVRT